jgi:Skp family chaperone for outer membrane proteins
VQTIRFSAALAASLASLIGFSSIAFGQVGGSPGVGAPGYGAPAAGGQPQAGNYGQPPAGAPQGAPPAGNSQMPSGHGINGMGVIDIKFLFTKYEKFDQQMQAIRARVEAAEAEIRREQEALKAKAEQAKGFDPSKAEFRQIEQEVVRRQGDLQLKIATQKRQILEEENRVYYNTVKEVDDAVKIVANRFNLNIVFRIMVEEPNPNNRNEIAMGLSKNIVFYHPQMDVTPYVLQELRRAGGGVAANPNAGRSQPPVPRQ